MGSCACSAAFCGLCSVRVAVGESLACSQPVWETKPGSFAAGTNNAEASITLHYVVVPSGVLTAAKLTSYLARC